MTTDLLETLEAMRPDSDALWPEDLRAAACARIIAADAERPLLGPVPGGRPPSSPSRRWSPQPGSGPLRHPG